MSNDENSSNKKIYRVDPQTCIGCSICVTVCPSGYKMNQAGKSEVIADHDADAVDMQEALEACPVGAIKSEES